MDTPTSQAQTKPPSISLEACLSELATGTFTYSQLAAFSDLSRQGLRQVESAWPSIDPALRRRLIAEAIDLANENILYQFDRLCRFALSDPHPDVRQVALSGLWEDQTESLLNELLEIARSDESADVRAGAIDLLGNALPTLLEDDVATELVSQIGSLVCNFASDASLSTVIRRRAIEAVGYLEPTEQTRALILAAFQHGDQALEAGALAAMGRSLESRWRTVVRSLLTSEDPELRFESAQALGQIGTADDIAELSKLALDEDADVRSAVILALGEIGGPGAVRVLRNLLEVAADSDRETIQDALDAALLSSDPLRTPS
jgi:HEAT repeat protein